MLGELQPLQEQAGQEVEPRMLLLGVALGVDVQQLKHSTVETVRQIRL